MGFQDLAFGWRTLLRSPGFAVAAIATLALGVGANTAIFSAVDEVLLRPLPVPQADRLAAVYRFNPKTSKYLSSSYPEYEDLRRESRSFESLAAYVRLQFNVSAAGHAERVPVEAVSGNYFAMLKLAPLAGRVLDADDDAAVLLGEEFWRARFQGDAAMVGKTVLVEGRPFVVRGIVPAVFHGPNLNWGKPPQMWMTLRATTELIPSFRTMNILNQRPVEWLLLLGRLRAGVTVAAAQAELQALRTDRDVTLTVFPASNAKFWPAYRSSIESWIAVFAGAAGLVLLLACANLSNLLLERALGRRREIAIRRALGASGGRIVRQMLAENLLLAAPGFVAAVGVASGLQRLLLQFPNAWGISLALRLGVETRVLIFCFALSLAASALFGVLPALQTARQDVVPALKESGNATAASGQKWLRQALVVAQVSFSMVLLVAGGMFGRSLLRAYAMDLGFRSDHLLAVSFSAPMQDTGERLQQFYAAMQRELSAMPGAVAVSAAAEMPLSPVHVTARVGGLSVNYNMVGPDYLRAMGIALLAGRDFGLRDGKDAPKVAVVNQSLARSLWGGANPLGRVMEFEDRPGRVTRVEVVGVARDSRYESIWESGEPYLYLPAAEWGRPVNYFLVRTSAPAQALRAALRGRWEAAAPDVPLDDVRTGDEVVASAVAPQRLAALLLGAFGGLAIVLAAVGLYSVMSFAVRQRAKEIGIRLAIGARPARILRDVLLEALTVAGWGLVLGLVGCWSAMHLLASLVHDMSPYDGATFSGVAALLVLVCVVAALVPALRASRTDPARALRGE